MNTAKLKAAAEKARWGDWSAYKPHSGARGYEVRVGIEAVAQHCLKDDAAFIAEASPKTVLCLIAALEAMTQGSPGEADGWIPCSERMPENDGNYWAWWSESKRQGPAWFIKSELQAQFQSSEITHWMPLPEAPAKN